MAKRPCKYLLLRHLSEDLGRRGGGAARLARCNRRGLGSLYVFDPCAQLLLLSLPRTPDLFITNSHEKLL